MTPTESTNGTVPAPLQKRLSVAELEKILPTPEEVAEQAQQLRAASVSAINVEDVNEMMAAVLAKAKQGDTRSVRLILDHLEAQKPKPGPGRPPLNVIPQPAAARPVEHPDPPKPVAIAGPGVEQHRRLVAFVLLAHQPMTVAGLGHQTGLSGEQLDAVLNHEWFTRKSGSVQLTPAGRNAVG